MRRTTGILLILVFVYGNSVIPQDYTVRVTTIHVWVKAIDSSGKPVTGLTQEDFIVSEDGKEVAITCFEEQVAPVTGSSTQAGTAKSATKQAEKVSRQFVLFLDLFNTSSRELNAIKPGLVDFATSLIRSGHEVMLATLRTDGRMGIVAPFTKDFSRIRILLNQARGGTDRVSMVQRNVEQVQRAIEYGGDETIDKVNSGYQEARSLATQEKGLTEYSLKAVEKFAEHMAKENLQDATVVYVSGGFSIDPGRQYYEVVDNFAQANLATGQEMLTVSLNRDMNLDMRNEIRRVFGKINRNNVTFYTIDAGGLGANAEYQDSLVEMADQTGGISFYNSQNFNLGFQKVQEDLNHQYLLCFQAPEHPKAGQYHKIKVVSKRPGVELRHRKGYAD